MSAVENNNRIDDARPLLNPTHRAGFGDVARRDARPICRARGPHAAVSPWRTSAVKALAIVAMLLAGLSVQSCSHMIEKQDIERTDLSSIGIGTARATVESILGPPITGEARPSGATATYSYDRGMMRAPASSGGSGGPSGQGAVAILMLYILLQPVLTPLAIAEREEDIERQKGEITIAYGPDDRVVAFETHRSLREKKGSDAQGTGSETQERAERGGGVGVKSGQEIRLFPPRRGT